MKQIITYSFHSAGQNLTEWPDVDEETIAYPLIKRGATFLGARYQDHGTKSGILYIWFLANPDEISLPWEMRVLPSKSQSTVEIDPQKYLTTMLVPWDPDGGSTRLLHLLGWDGNADLSDRCDLCCRRWGHEVADIYKRPTIEKVCDTYQERWHSGASNAWNIFVSAVRDECIGSDLHRTAAHFAVRPSQVTPAQLRYAGKQGAR